MARKAKLPATMGVYDIVYLSGSTTVYAATFTSDADALGFKAAFAAKNPSYSVFVLTRQVAADPVTGLPVDFCPQPAKSKPAPRKKRKS
jgi:hypothetical protein